LLKIEELALPHVLRLLHENHGRISITWDLQKTEVKAMRHLSKSDLKSNIKGVKKYFKSSTGHRLRKVQLPDETSEKVKKALLVQELDFSFESGHHSDAIETATEELESVESEADHVGPDFRAETFVLDYMAQNDIQTIQPFFMNRGGLTAAQIAALPSSTSFHGECHICFDSLKHFAFSGDGGVIAADLTKLPCNHVLHRSCLIPWLAGNRTCPACRRNVIE
jgi:hypothetical protein